MRELNIEVKEYMIKINSCAKIFLLSILAINVFIMMVPIHETDFGDSDHFFAGLLRGLGYQPQEPVTYNHIPTLTSDSLSNTSQNQFNFNTINSKISAYFTPGWADTRWRFRKNITISSSKVSADLTNFPVYIEVFDSGLQKNAQASGNDIMFSDVTGSILDHEIELYERVYNSSHAHLVAWVKVNASSITDTVISMYYGNPTASNQQNPTGVWDENYMGVWHLKESPSGEIDELVDSTSNDNDGYTVGSMNETDLIDSQIGYGLDLDGIDDMIIINESTSLDSINDAGTISFWINVLDPSNGDYQRIMASSNTFPHRTSGLELALQSDGDLFFYPCEEDANNYNLLTNPLANSAWEYVTITMDFATKTVEIYVNGTSLSFTIENVPSYWTQLAIIDDWIWGGDDYHYKLLTAIFDEIRVSDIVRSSDWILTEYSNQNDPNSFYTIGIEEEKAREIGAPSAIPWYNQNWLYRNKLTINQTKVGIDPYFKEITITTGSSALPLGY